MYNYTSYSIKTSSSNLKPIRSNLGLKQGCPLSPILFNLYIDDVEDIFDSTCEPVTLSETKINHFLYADDLIIVSLTQIGLQRSLDKLTEYAIDKDLTINSKKSKTMTFNPGGRLININLYLHGPIRVLIRLYFH